MSKKMKVKLKPGKAKIKVKSDGDTLPLDSIAVDRLLGATLEIGALPHQKQPPNGLLNEPAKRMRAGPETDAE